MPLTLTDDILDSFCLELHDWIERHPLANTEEGYDWLRDFVYSQLENYSNGYKNYN